MDIKYDVCVSNNGKGKNHTRHIYRRVNFIRNDKNCKMHKIDWCEGGLQLADISTKNVGDNYLNTRMKYIMVSLENWKITLVQDMWHNTKYCVVTRVLYD